MERFTKDHEYIRVDGDVGVIGITDHAQEKLGDIVFAEVPEAGRTVKAGEGAAVVESVKAASDVYSPVSGEVVEGNAEVGDNPALINESAEDKGWFFKVKLSDKAELEKLMDRAAYEAFLKDDA